MTHVAHATRRRGFTLIEMLVVLVVLGVLAALAMVGYAQVAERAQTARAVSNLSQVATAVVAQATLTDASQLDRPLIKAALLDGSGIAFTDGITSATTWRLGTATQAPTGPNDYAVGFDHGVGTGAAQDDGGSRVVVVTSTGSVSWARIITWPATTTAPGTVPTGTTPTDVLDNPALITTPGTPATTPPPAADPAPTDLNLSNPPGPITWTGGSGPTGNWCVDFLTAGTWARQGCTTTNTWPTNPGPGKAAVYWRPVADSAPSALFCPSFTTTTDWSTTDAFGTWITTAGVPAGYDWSTLHVSAKHYPLGSVVADKSDPDVWSSPSGWFGRVLYAGFTPDGLIPGDLYVLEITGPGLYPHGCMTAFAGQSEPAQANGGWAGGINTDSVSNGSLNWSVTVTAPQTAVGVATSMYTASQRTVTVQLSGPLGDLNYYPRTSVQVRFWLRDPAGVLSMGNAYCRFDTTSGPTCALTTGAGSQALDHVEILDLSGGSSQYSAATLSPNVLTWYPAGSTSS